MVTFSYFKAKVVKFAFISHKPANKCLKNPLKMNANAKNISTFSKYRFPIVFGGIFFSMVVGFVYRRSIIGDTLEESRRLNYVDPTTAESLAAFIREHAKLQEEKAKKKLI